VCILRRRSAVDDGFTTRPGAYELLATRPASVKPASARRMSGELLEQLGIAARATLSVWLRYDSVTRSLTAQDAVEFDGVRYDIVAPPAEVGRRQGVELLIVTSDAP
jgi:head-tail adaptor